MKKAGIATLIILAIMATLLLFPQAEAKIYLDEPLSLYNLGQKITFVPKILPTENFNGYFKLALVCSQQGIIKEQVIYFSPIVLEENSEKVVDVSFQIMNKGVCAFEASLQNTRYATTETEKTKNFTSTDLININLELNKVFFFPEEELTIKGKIVKANGQAFTGPATLTIANTTMAISVKDGKFEYTYVLPSDIDSGAKEVKVYAEDAYNNKGEKLETITIASVPTRLLIEISEGTDENPNLFMPGEVISIKSTLLDQSNKVMNKEIVLEIEQNKKTVYEEIIRSDESTIYRFKKDSRAGDYILKFSSQGIESEKMIYLAELKEISIELEENILHVINIGNVPYQEPIEITFSQGDSSETKIVELDLDIGEETFIKLEAPTGNYELSIDGKTLHESLTFEGVPLTGQVTAAVDLGQGFNFRDIVVFILIFMTISMAITLFVSRMKRERIVNLEKKEEKQIEEKVRKEVSKGKSRIIGLGEREEKERIEEEIETKAGKVSVASDASKKRLLREKSILQESDDEFSQAVKKIFSQHSYKTGAKTVIPGLIFGDKRPITALFVRIDGLRSLSTLRKKEPHTFEKIMNEYFSVIVDKIRSHMGIAEIYGNTILVIFNAIKQYSHDMSAIKAASDIRSETVKFNERHKDVAELHTAAGINTGYALLSTITENKVLKYLSLEDTTYIAKQLEQKANSNEIVISDNTYQRLKNSLDVKKLSPLFLSREKAIDNYNLGELSLRAKHKDYIDRVVREYKKQKKYS